MTKLEQRKYCGQAQNKIQELTGVFCDASSTGEALFINKDKFEKVKHLGLNFKFYKSSSWYSGYLLMINKTTLKTLSIQ